ncbi:MmgE/PrpD family protein [Alteribacillus iranensis]|uniref:2-methylcitrate dehydratase PrpD n=1 Tax=Alteribacillus iranensis TaxID=930128 RepID=A0A1I2DJP8_9BACI|nr:MmgE/PrpD family protein [Alteribacillus iranensis]SFE80531.1 2-methylcitrate dehydratase PrpD [Alteribacillus iranensis]
MIIDEINKFIEDLEYDNLSPTVINMTKHCLLDFIGSSFAGYQSKSAEIVLQSSVFLGEDGECTVIGNGKTFSPLVAAFANGTLASSLDIDDGHRNAVGHPSSVVLPSLLAVVDSTDRIIRGKDFLTAMVAGYEIGIRSGIVMNSNHEQFFYGSGGWAIFGAAAGTSKLLMLKKNQLKNALAISDAFRPTAQCEKSIKAGAMTKESVGWGSTTGLFSTLLAKDGFSGPDGILQDDHLYNIDANHVLYSLGREYKLEDIYFKQYPSCKWSHSSITAAIEIKKEYHPAIEDIEEVLIETFNKAVTLDHVAPETTEAAQYSIPFTVAVALCYGELKPYHISDNNLGDKQVRNIAKKVRIVSNPELEKLFPDKRPARLSIRMANDKVFEKEVHVTRGDPEQPFTLVDIVDKFHALTHPYINKKQRNNIVEQVIHFERINDVTHFTRLLQ